jgi:hypothetical protein
VLEGARADVVTVAGTTGSWPKAMAARQCPYRAVAGRDSRVTVAPPPNFNFKLFLSNYSQNHVVT